MPFILNLDLCKRKHFYYICLSLTYSIKPPALSISLKLTPSHSSGLLRSPHFLPSSADGCMPVHRLAVVNGVVIHTVSKYLYGMQI